VPDQAAAHGAKFVIHPDGNFKSLGPENCCAAGKDRVTKDREKTQRRTGAPIHTTSQIGEVSDASSSETAGWGGRLLTFRDPDQSVELVNRAQFDDFKFFRAGGSRYFYFIAHFAIEKRAADR
jgi:hypothetical protein